MVGPFGLSGDLRDFQSQRDPGWAKGRWREPGRPENKGTMLLMSSSTAASKKKKASKDDAVLVAAGLVIIKILKERI